MTHPAEITEAWQALAAAAGTPDQPSKTMADALAALEEVGFLIHITADGAAIADATEPLDRDGQTFLHGSLRIDQVG